MAQVSMRANKEEESKGFPIADEGDYWLRVTQVKDGQTSDRAKNPNCQKVDLLIVILDDNGDKVGSCWHTLTFIPAGKPGHGMWLHANHAFGLPYDGEVNYDTADYMDTECRGHVIVDTWEGKTRNKISEFYTEDDNQGSAGSGSAPAPAAEAAPAEEVSESPPTKKRNATPPKKDEVDLEQVPF